MTGSPWSSAGRWWRRDSDFGAAPAGTPYACGGYAGAWVLLSVRAAGEDMSDAVIFVVVFAGFFLLRAIAATVFFLYLLPDGDRCPHCNAVTLRMESPVLNRLLPMFRTSWCYECGWHGLLRRGPLTPVAPAELLTKLPTELP